MGPLTGVRILEFAGIGPAPFCGMLLADLGADLVRIDRIGGAGLFGLDPRLDLPNRGKRSVALDLKHLDGRATALRLVGRADALLEGFRPGVMERLGLGPEACLGRNPRLVYGRMTGWGQHGPLAPRAGHDIDYIALSGALHAIGRAPGPPAPPLNLVGDFGGGALYLALGVLAGLLESARSGRGQVVDAAIVDGVASLLTPTYGLLHAGLWRDRRAQNLLDGGCPWYDVYETRDGKHVAVGAIEPPFYEALLAGLGIDPATLPGQWDRDRWPELRKRFAEAFKQLTRDEWAARFADTDACVAPVLSLTEAAAHPHAAVRESFLEWDGVKQPGPAPRFSRTPGSVRHGPPEPGAHTTEVLVEWGFSRSEVIALRESGAVG